MLIFIVEQPRKILLREDLKNRWLMRRAVVASIEAEGAVNWVIAACAGEEVFSGEGDNGKFARPADRPFFDPDTCTVFEIGEETGKEFKGSRILAWELAAPESSSE